MRRLQATAEEDAYIRENYLSISQKQIAKTLKRTPSFVKNRRMVLHLFIPVEITNKRRGNNQSSATIEEDNYIRENCLKIPAKEIARTINRSSCFVRGRIKKLGIIIPREIIDQFCNRYPKGHIPSNKGKKMAEATYEKVKNTFFTKGHRPHNTKYDGCISVRLHKNGFPHIVIRTELGIWKEATHITWEQHKGPVPEGMIVAVKDGNPNNCFDINNLELITRKQNMLRNSIHNYPQEIKEVIYLNKNLKKEIKKYEQRH